MTQKNLLFVIILTAMTLCKVYGQVTTTYGNLVRIGFNQKEVSSGDTLGSWMDTFGSSGYYSYSYDRYYEHITTPQRNYFIKKSEGYWSSQYMTFSMGKRLLETEGKPIGRQFGTTDVGWDCMGSFMIDRTIVTDTKNGHWLINGAFGNAFIFNNDSLLLYSPWNYSGPNKTMTDRIRIIAGKVNNKFLASFIKDNLYSRLEYFLVNPDDSPYFDSLKSEKVTFIDNYSGSSSNYITGIRKITDDLYAVKYEGSDFLDIYRFSADTMFYVKSVLKNEFSGSRLLTDKWECRNGKLYHLNFGNLANFEFRSSDTSFVNKKVLLDSLSDSYDNHNSNYGIDRNLKYVARIFRHPDKNTLDTLKIYDIQKEEFIGCILLEKLNHTFKPVVDSPYVYVHQITKEYVQTRVNDSKANVVKSYSITAYPNPFNPSTKIIFSIPEAQDVKLKVYDMLGKEISTLVNEFRPAGSHTVQFNAGSLPSGIYIYTIQAGQYRDSKKLILLK